MPALAQAAAKPFLIALIGSSLRLVNSHSPVVASSSKILKTFCAGWFSGINARLAIFPLSNQNRLGWHEHLPFLDPTVTCFIAKIDVLFLECDGNGKASVHSSDDASTKLREQIAFIKAKEHVAVKEAALLLSCSESHIPDSVAHGEPLWPSIPKSENAPFACEKDLRDAAGMRQRLNAIRQEAHERSIEGALKGVWL